MKDGIDEDVSPPDLTLAVPDLTVPLTLTKPHSVQCSCGC